MAWIYILQSLRDKRFYIGSTNILKQRIRHHCGGFTHSTRRFGKLKLAFSQKFSNIKEAQTIERKLKRLKRKDYIEKIIKEGVIKMRA